MDCVKIGKLIARLRREKGMTQKQLAERLGISGKTVSKWETGQGCPDLSSWTDLSAHLGADLVQMLEGEITPNRPDSGKLQRIRFYRCPSCGNILTSTGSASVSCCGRKLDALPEGAPPVPAEAEEIDGEYYVSFAHSMTKEHHLVFAAYTNNDLLLLRRLYPEQDASLRIPLLRGGTLYLCCTEHGLSVIPNFLPLKK